MLSQVVSHTEKQIQNNSETFVKIHSFPASDSFPVKQWSRKLLDKVPEDYVEQTLHLELYHVCLI